jgi:hypothetical protein
MSFAARYFRLPRHERALVIRAAIAVAAVKCGLMTIGFAGVRRLTARPPQRMSNHHWCLTMAPPKARALIMRPGSDRIAWAVQAASLRIPGAANCLVRAIACEYLLGRYGYASELKIGASRNEAGKFAAHAWLESEGRVVVGDFELERYVPLASPVARTGSIELR